MGIQHESTIIGDVRPVQVNATPGVGATLLQFMLQWRLHPKRQDDYSVFGTYLRISVAVEGTTDFLHLGQAMPQAAWTEEARPGYSHEHKVTYHLTLHTDQLLALERIRQGRGLTFALDVRGNSLGPVGIRPIDEPLRLNVSLSEWLRVLREAAAADVLLVGLDLPFDDSPGAIAGSVRLVRRAHKHLMTGEYDTCIAECRRAIESLWASLGVEGATTEARDVLGTKDRKAMSKHQRMLAIGEAVRHLTHLAHHVDGNGNAAIFSQRDATLVLASTASLVSVWVPSVSGIAEQV